MNIRRFATLGPAPTSVRWARVIAPLVMCFAYLALRVAPATHERIALAELLTSGVLFVGLTFLAFIALGDLIDPEPLPPRLEDDVTQAMPPVDGWRYAGLTKGGWRYVGLTEGGVTAKVTYADLALMFPERFAPGAGRIVGSIEYEPATEELELLTHEYVPQHHTPPRGFPSISNGFRLVGDHGEGIELDAFGQRVGGGRHRKAGA